MRVSSCSFGAFSGRIGGIEPNIAVSESGGYVCVTVSIDTCIFCWNMRSGMLIKTMDARAFKFVVGRPGILRGKRNLFGKENSGLSAVNVTLSGHALSPEASGTFPLFIHTCIHVYLCACRMCYFVVKPAL